MRTSTARESTSSSLKHREQGKETPPGLASSHRVGGGRALHPRASLAMLGVRIGGDSRNRSPALGRTGFFGGRKRFYLAHGCLPGRAGLGLQGEQGQQVQGSLAGHPLGRLCHGDLPRERESQGWEGRRGCFEAPGGRQPRGAAPGCCTPSLPSTGAAASPTLPCESCRRQPHACWLLPRCWHRLGLAWQAA